ncbi:MAG: small GTP-binding protein domain protein [Planctomycetota bacterium]|nr:small GTP-binding protein domain protein [Planctomycetota bacterium]
MILLDSADTIAAIASPPGPAVRGIVRLSGSRALEIAREGFHPSDDRPWSRGAERREGRLTVSGLRSRVPAALILWPGTKTYTGEPTAEIHTIGCAPILEQILADCLARGARLAEPGEFTLRAFVSGRIDLTRAEAVLGVIEASSPAQLDAALAQLAGGIASPIEALRDRLLDVLAHLEANLDFADEPDVDPLGRASLAQEFATASRELHALGERLQGRDRPETRPRVVLAGPPNAGKSRLFNALAGETRALVSAIAGTTRDYLWAEITCDGLSVSLIDTAGTEAPRDEIEVQAQGFRDEQTATADLVLRCISADAHGEYRADGRAGRCLLVVTKADLAIPHRPGAIITSAATGAGLDALRTAIAVSLENAASDAVAGTSARCKDSLIRAGDALQSASLTLTLGGGDELVAIDLRQALDDLGRVVGAVVTDDILDRIFRRFCIGK